MKLPSLRNAVIAMLIACCAAYTTGYAEHRDHDDRHDYGGHGDRPPGGLGSWEAHGQNRGPGPRPGPGGAAPDHYRFDDRFHHDRYYPRFGYEVDRLPDWRRHVRYHDHDYFYSAGIWYRPWQDRFVVIAPPIGIVVPTLPSVYTTLWVSGIPYYYANDAYYVWRPGLNGYEVTQPPSDLDQQPVSELTEQLFIYPKNGQSEQQQADDRYACHTWSTGQTDYDPSQPPTNLSTQALRDKRADYNRAMRACLEGRGYSVR